MNLIHSVVDLPADQIDEFASELKADFYAEREMIRDAISRGRAFNLIHFKSAYKFDLFPLCKDEFSRTEFARRRFTMLRSLGPEPIECAIASAEDTILVSSNGIAPVAKPPSGGGTIRGASCVSAATNWTGINSTHGQVS